MYRGYVKMYRRIMDSAIWLAEKFTRGQAWADLILLANHKDGFIRKRGIKIDLKRGDVGWSERELAKRWRWSRDKTRRFLFELCSGDESKLIPQTSPQNKNITSCYSIVNYEMYQGNNTTNPTTDRPQTGHKQDQNKNDKNEKKIKHKYGKFKNVLLTDDEFQKIKSQFTNSSTLIENLSYYIGSKGDKYKSHYKTILSWERKNNPSGEFAERKFVNAKDVQEKWKREMKASEDLAPLISDIGEKV